MFDILKDFVSHTLSHVFFFYWFTMFKLFKLNAVFYVGFKIYLISFFQILIEVDNLQDAPSRYLQIKGVNKEAVAAAGSMLKLDGSYTTKVFPLLFPYKYNDFAHA